MCPFILAKAIKIDVVIPEWGLEMHLIHVFPGNCFIIS